MKAMIAGLAALALAAASPPAYADNGCFGCNVRDAGAFDESLVGAAVYVEAGANSWGRVERIDRRTGRAHVRMADGDMFETSALNIYSRASRNERTSLAAVAITAGAAIALCVFGACGGDEPAPADPDAELEGAP